MDLCAEGYEEVQRVVPAAHNEKKERREDDDTTDTTHTHERTETFIPYIVAHL